ncbi:MAG: hypothetical protein WCV99_10340 [Sterolibacterium sp.]|jgi:hypothetical protein
MWQHAQHSQQPPIYDAFSYYLKAHNFWAEMQQQKLFHYFNVEPSFRPPGTILMSYPFGFDTDYRGFYFRSVFFPIVLLSLAVVIGGYRRELDSKSKWHLALIAVFLSCLPCFYHFEVSPTIPASDHWGLVDNFLAGMAALAAAAAIRSCWTGSLAWVGLAAILSSFCLLIKPVGILIMMLVGLLWFGLSMLNLKSTWASPGKRKSASRWLLNGMVIFAVPYLLVLAVSFTSHYLSSSNLAYGNAAIVVMRNEIPLSWIDVMFRVHEGPGFPFMAWLLLMLTLVAGNNWRMSAGVLPWSRPTLIGLALASCGTFVFGIWFWLFGSGGATQTRYFIPFVLMAAILALPAILTAVRGLAGWKAAILSVFMIAPVINSAMLLLQRHAPAEWQQWAGVNLTAGAADPVMLQAQHFVDGVKHEGGSNVVLYSISMNMADSFFSAAIEYAGIAMPPMPIRSMVRPVDWQRPSTYRKKEMLDTDYWLFQPVRDPEIRRNMLAKPSIDTFEQEKALFEAWATQLTADEGVVTVSDTPSARVLRIADLDLLEPAFDALVAAHHWRDAFTAANPKRLFNEVDLAAALAQNPPSLENVDFSGRFQIRAISLGRTGDEITLRFWWKPLSPLPDQDWAIFIHSIDAEGKIVRATGMPIRFNRPLSALNGAVLFDQITISNPVAAGTPRLAFGFVRPNQAPLIADRGARDWDSRRVIVSAP